MVVLWLAPEVTGVMNIPVTVRRAREADIAGVSQIERASFGDPWPDEAFQALLERDVAWFAVAEAPEGDRHRLKVAGYLVALVVADEAEIANIAVHNDVRGRGVGGALLDAALDEARSRGVTSVYLEVRESNASARSLYESRGFRKVGRRRGYYRRPVEDAIVLRKTIAHDAGPHAGGSAAVAEERRSDGA